MKKVDLPKKLAVFRLSNFIIFPKTSVPLNIFKPRYVDMINDSMTSNKLVGMIQPKISKDDNYNHFESLVLNFSSKSDYLFISSSTNFWNMLFSSTVSAALFNYNADTLSMN